MAEERAAALVVLKPASGADRSPNEAITTATLRQNAPDPGVAERLRSHFVRQGFEVGPLVGISFSIAGPRELMSGVFPGYAQSEGTDAELPLDALPEDLRSAVQAVATEAPPEFGPWNP
jgi:hypothetical protein